MRWRTLLLKSSLTILASQKQLRWFRSQRLTVWFATSAMVLSKTREEPKLAKSVRALESSRASFLRPPWTPWKSMLRITAPTNLEACSLTALLSNRMLKQRLSTKNLFVTAAILVLSSVFDTCAQFAMSSIFVKSVSKLKIMSILFSKLENLSKLPSKLSASTGLALKSKWNLWIEKNFGTANNKPEKIVKHSARFIKENFGD